ncbi:FAD-binding protein [Gammaproteobacteria bacterium LSUCC0057]|uniref:FAD-binding protein n=1 Tax=Gammaproteobacteria bacterium LSUCC0057 TaxID=2559237 RepID=A0A4Y8UNE1_9GAMM|nr:FAD-binding protein [Gammaproteobacteria bacterium LSUCC0057]
MFTSANATLDASHVVGWDHQFDVVVVGYGGAGASAAIAAHDAGANVAIFDLASAPGGSTALSSAELYLGGGTRVQQACGYHDTPQAMYDYLMASNGPQADSAKIRAYCDGSVDHFNWLVELGVPFKDSEYQQRAMMALSDDCLLYTGNEKSHPFNQLAPPAPRGHNLQVKGDNGGPLFIGTLAAAIAARGIAQFFDSRALRLVIDHSGDAKRVVGVVFRIDMQEVFVRAERGVVLCAGGFVMNQTMVEQYAPDLLRCTVPVGNPGDTGSGIAMGVAAGGVAINMHEGFVSLPFYPPASTTFGIFINDKCQRFINEDAYHGRVGSALLRQPGERIYLLLNIDDYGDYETRSYLGAPVAGTGECVVELACELQLDSHLLQQCIELYNHGVARGEDRQFHKHSDWLKMLDWPLVALDCTPGRGVHMPYFTLGGLKTAVDGAVLDGSEQPIAGLFAAGRTACGVPRRGDGYCSGISIGDASFSGRVAGRAAANIQ